MKKFLLALVATVTLSGCASTYQLTSTYQETKTGAEYGEVFAKLSRHQESGFLKTTIQNQVEIYIKDELVLKAPLHEDYSGDFYFFYQGMPVAVDCVQPDIFSRPECSVQINGRRAGKLAFAYR